MCLSKKGGKLKAEKPGQKIFVEKIFTCLVFDVIKSVE